MSGKKNQPSPLPTSSEAPTKLEREIAQWREKAERLERRNCFDTYAHSRLEVLLQQYEANEVDTDGN